ncbi:hypothetical protein GCM10017771_53390 [Streptomyces capitiformicae]|uniref:PASTA domain-containing protein n=1 Tax=Streptomyces capitiformicae TaxID=2014920 RepID=A0A919DBV9_9ACTN|nr:hypothetical protein GCM10017771_53390 [Streptomyces capitiformicae]
MGVVILSGCGDSVPTFFAVKAVAAGVPSLAPFFDEGERLGRDEPGIASQEPHSGLQQGNTPGLYGGTRKPNVCDVDKLEDFLNDPKNKKKAQVWADIAGVKIDGIGNYLDDLTPVLLRHDTLVKNHDYKKGKGVPFDALLEAGIAVLVDEQGLPAVKCSCGNPLRAFDEDPQRIKVEFDDDNKKWDGYDESALVVVKPAPEQLKEIKLVDVEDSDTGISREVGSTGESDETFDTRERQAVPRVQGMTFSQASEAMAAKGLAVTVAGDEMPPGDAPVTGSEPGPGTELEFGAAVALNVDWPEDRNQDKGGSTHTPSGPEPTGTGTGTGPGPTGPSGRDSSSPGGGGTPEETGSPEPSDTPSRTESSPEPSDTPSATRSSPEKPTPSPTPTPTPTPTPKPTPTPTQTPSKSSAPPPPPPPEPSTPEVSPTSVAPPPDPEPSSDPPSETPGDPGGDPGDPGGDPGDPGGDPADPVEDPAQPVRL